MSPKLSPKKSVEGLVGGILGAGVLGLLYGLWFNQYVHEINNLPVIFLVICAVGALPAVVGDLADSLRKDS